MADPISHFNASERESPRLPINSLSQIDVAQRNMPRSGMATFLRETIPKEHLEVLAKIKILETHLAEAQHHRAFIERVAAAAGITLPGPVGE